MAAPRLWDVFCRVIDNFGDIGVCWRLSADLAARGNDVRLWTDDASALAWMAPAGARGVQVLRWADASSAPQPADVVIEAFGCDPPPEFVARMAARHPPPVWINLEHLSAETFVERSHGLPSPQRNGLTKWFFYPGFTERTGGLLREEGLLAERSAFDRAQWLSTLGVELRPGERVVTLFCYQNPALPALVQALSDRPTLLLPTQGQAQRQIGSLELPSLVRSVPVPWLSQRQFDHLLWCGDLNVVRGEDSLVRALWAGAPFLWHIYPQHDKAHDAKLQAFVLALCAGADARLVDALMALSRRFNGLEDGPLQWPDTAAWRDAVDRWRSTLAEQEDLCSQLQRFASRKG
jgi:uncharacterized repeat protein (TIGR03837 family)